MTLGRFVVAACMAAGLAMVLQADQGTALVPTGAPGQGGGGAARQGGVIGGTLTPAAPDGRGWGWQVKASVNPATPRPFYNKAKELLFQDQRSRQ